MKAVTHTQFVILWKYVLVLRASDLLGMDKVRHAQFVMPWKISEGCHGVICWCKKNIEVLSMCYQVTNTAFLPVF